VLHHLDDDTAQQFMALAKAGLKPGGRVLTLDACYMPKQNPIARFLISKDRGQHVRNEAGYRAVAKRIFTGITGAVTHWVWPPYTHWSMECSVRSQALVAGKQLQAVYEEPMICYPPTVLIASGI
jgi:hypothetical protein